MLIFFLNMSDQGNSILCIYMNEWLTETAVFVNEPFLISLLFPHLTSLAVDKYTRLWVCVTYLF